MTLKFSRLVEVVKVHVHASVGNRNTKKHKKRDLDLQV